ncbi:hypothetical protein IWX81_001317 [Salinibacterium sp. CAN_S4]|uniref:hypothetical protein n=1 Tax=Salinibacterium sp. CAN_S4 TaxID=2787727 RepID=UPI0018EF536D
MSIVLDILGSLLLSLAPDFVPKGRAADRRLLAQDKVRCGIRASDGRVLNIGTEWSTGVCEISPGHLRFVPSVGIVGDREIDVIDVRMTQERPHEQMVMPWGESADLVITTKAGELHWKIPEHIANEVIARLSPLTV